MSFPGFYFLGEHKYLVQEKPSFAPPPPSPFSLCLVTQLSILPRECPVPLPAHGGLGVHSPVPDEPGATQLSQPRCLQAAPQVFAWPLEIMRKRTSQLKQRALQSVWDQMERRCFHDFWTSAVPTATSLRSLPAAQNWALFSLSDIPVSLVSKSLLPSHITGSFCARKNWRITWLYKEPKAGLLKK